MYRTRLFAASALFMALTGAAYAGATISDKRYWPDDARATDAYRAEQTDWRRARAMETKAAPQARQRECNYQGGPKFSACSR